ncbi:cupin domain-containing protein [Altererythrobacter sp. ZODW24]|uniref:ribosomal protein uL16 3-hydroxylase n=1 Tax=Altererythrobacter sp. ZODW24 TaxID=2185142 RepID=UPI000DF816BD|nr:cupin domain-containing protein [Altererythrobacter sp. ZODW24]
MQLQNFDTASFLRDYWQKKPLLIRAGLCPWVDPLDPNELAGLSLEQGTESRLVIQGEGGPSVEHGPQDSERLSKLPTSGWTLLVQAVDHQVPEVAALIEPFRFVPNWRIDDVMVSCAADGGGVGPHYDQYDVFLVQGAGKRRWQVGAKCDETTPLVAENELMLIDGFEATDEWVLETGDILYVPPGYAHNGVAVGDGCMTYSIGFRAPARSELIAHWTDHLIDEMAEDDRYSDPALAMQANPGEIAPAAIDALHAMVTEKLGDRAAFARWFGEYSTAPKYPDVDWQPEEPVSAGDMRDLIASGAALLRNPASRWSFAGGEGGAVSLFVDGASYDCTGETASLAEAICAADRIDLGPDAATDEASRELLVALINQGSLAFEQED